MNCLLERTYHLLRFPPPGLIRSLDDSASLATSILAEDTQKDQENLRLKV
jgi:hypothetical protein